MHCPRRLSGVLSSGSPMVQLDVVESHLLERYRRYQPRDKIDRLLNVGWQQILQHKGVSLQVAILDHIFAYRPESHSLQLYPCGEFPVSCKI